LKLSKGVLGGLAWGDVVPLDRGLLRPFEDREAGQLGAVVGDQAQGLATPGDDGIELARHPGAGERGVGHQAETFPGEVIDHRQDAEPPPVGEAVAQEVKRPALIRSLRDRHRPPRPQRPLAPATAADLQPLLGVEPPELLMVHPDPLTPQQHPQPPIAEPTANPGQLPQPGPDRRIVRP
jgi:hypothetical protein